MNLTTTAQPGTGARRTAAPGASAHQPASAGVPGYLLLAIGYMSFLAIDQMHWWRLKADYSFGWLVPPFVAYLLFERWTRLRAGPSSVVPGVDASRWEPILNLAAGGVFLIGLALFAMGALYRAGSGPTQPGSLALAVGFSLMFPAMTFLSLPTGPGRLEIVRLVLFPSLVWLISAPLVSAVENALSLFLLRKVVAVVFFAFDFFGYPLIREGNVLMLPHGQVGVADACSGIRSLTGCLFAGSFLAAAFLGRMWQKVLLVGLAMGLAFLTNLARSLFLTGWAYAHGSQAIEGTLHDVTGYAVLGLTSLGLFGILPLFRRSFWARWAG